MVSRYACRLGLAAVISMLGCSGEDGPSARAYILFGQSNMWGAPPPEEEDMVQNPSVEVLTLRACAAHGMGEWVVAQPPLHGCVGTMTGEPGLGPGDTFAKAMAEAYPEETILLIPNAIPGVSITCFSPPSAGLDPGDYCGGESGETYLSMVERAKAAQARGKIEAILFHQGESDCGNLAWPSRVGTVVEALRDDLGIGEVPFLAGEIPAGSACMNHNPRVRGLPDSIPNAHVVPAEDLAIFDEYHFDAPSQRTLGRRYAEVLLGR